MVKTFDNGSPTKYYCFTVNNPSSDDDKQLSDLSAITKYLIFGREKGESDTLHYQGYVELFKPQRFSWIKKRLTRAHIEPKGGSRTQAREYCKKDGDFTEYGTFTVDKQGKRNDLLHIRNEIKRGTSLDELEDQFFGTFARYGRYLRDYAKRRQPKRSQPPIVIIHWGASGTGKTRAVFDLGDVCQVDYTNSFFQGYDNSKRVLIDDIQNPVSLFGRRLLLRLLDRYPLEVNIKNGSMVWNPEEIHFTTNFDPSEWLEDTAIKRRVTEVRHYGE